jgi:hypothetical protein
LQGPSLGLGTSGRPKPMLHILAIYRHYCDILQKNPSGDKISIIYHDNFSNYHDNMEIIALLALISPYNWILGL